MKISQDIREDARKQNEVATGMAEMAEKFRESGGEILVPIASADQGGLQALREDRPGLCPFT